MDVQKPSKSARGGTSGGDKEKGKRVRFTQEEEDALTAGHNRYGGSTNQWQNILNAHRVVFHVSRTGVDLKDKWRNMMKAQARGN